MTPNQYPFQLGVNISELNSIHSEIYFNKWLKDSPWYCDKSTELISLQYNLLDFPSKNADQSNNFLAEGFSNW